MCNSDIVIVIVKLKYRCAFSFSAFVAKLCRVIGAYYYCGGEIEGSA